MTDQPNEALIESARTVLKIGEAYERLGDPRANALQECAKFALRETAASPTGGKARGVAGPVWREAEDEGVWTTEVQTVGGHAVIATFHGGSEAEARLRRDAFLRWLNSAPTSSVAADGGLRKAVEHLMHVGEFCRTDDTESALRAVENALSTPTPPSADLREALDACGYQRVFNAIADAVNPNATGIGISVEAFIKSLTGVDRASTDKAPETPSAEAMREALPPVSHARDCAYVTETGPAPCTCDFYAREQAAIATLSPPAKAPESEGLRDRRPEKFCYTIGGSIADRQKATEDWVRRAMRFIDLADADPTDYADTNLHGDAERLTIDGYMLFGADVIFHRWSLADLEYRQMTAFMGLVSAQEAAKEAENACLVPPDGGSPTEEERQVCNRVAAAILALATPATEARTYEDGPRSIQHPPYSHPGDVA